MSDNKAIVMQSADELSSIAKLFVESGYFADSKSVAQAAVKIMAGREMGFGPFASMTGIYIIQGRPSIGANLLASAIKASGRYDYRVQKMSETVCEILFLSKSGEHIGISRFTIEDARRAGTKNLDKFPRNMLFARAISNGHRWYCPDALGGAAVYTPEELGATINEAGDVIDVQPVVSRPEPVGENVDPLHNLRTAGAMTTNKGTRLDSVDDDKLMYAAEHATNGLKAAAEYLMSTPSNEEYLAYGNAMNVDTGDAIITLPRRIDLLRILNA